MQRYGMTIPFDGVPLHEQRDWIVELADLGYTDVWSSEANGADAFTPLALASAWAPSLRLGTAIVPGIYDSSLADEDLGVSTEEAFELTRRLAGTGLFVGISSGANLAGALKVARRVSDAVIVVVFCDGGEKYLSERFWDETEGDR